jgi:tetratricopeptide (TPR) repeat protein
MSFPLYCKAVELLTPADGPAAAQRELRRLRQIASEQPALLGSYLDFAQAQAKRLGIQDAFTAELRTLWANGSGPVAAGAVLLASELDQPKQAEETLGRILARDDAGEVWLLRLTGVLDAASKPELALRVRERLAQINPAVAQPALDWALALHKLGRNAEARAVLEKLAMRTVIDEDSTGKVAQAFVMIGDAERAKTLFVQALRSDPYARNFPAYLDFARLQVAGEDFNGARRTLRVAFTNPANREFGLVADFLTAAGRVAEVENEITALGLSVARQTHLRRELFARLAKERQVGPALALIDGHPAALTPAICGALRTLGKESRDFQPIAALLEKLAKQSPENVEVTLELARLYADWSEDDLAASKTDAALEHLGRGHELRPDVFEVARQLATLQSQTGSAKTATATLESFLAAGTNAAEIAKAQEMLARVKQGGKL